LYVGGGGYRTCFAGNANATEVTITLGVPALPDNRAGSISAPWQ